MIGILLGIFAGLGLFFIGMRMISNQLKEITGERVRVLAARLTRSRPLMMMLGTTAGIATQSTNAVTAAATGLATAQLIGLRDAFTLIACANIGTSVLVFLAASSLHDAVLLITAICGLLYFLGIDKKPRYRVLTGSLLSFVLIVSGLDLIEMSSRQLRDVPMVQSVLGAVAGWPAAAFLVGAALVPIVQTAKTVGAIVAVLALSDVLDPMAAISAVIGANATSAVNVAFLTARISPAGRALALYQALLKLVGSATAIVVLLALAVASPGTAGAIAGAAPALAVAVGYLFMQVTAYGLLIPFETTVERWLTRLTARAAADDPTRPRFITREALSEPASAVELALREHLLLLAHLPSGLDDVRMSPEPAVTPRRDADAILRALEDFLATLAHGVSDERLRRRIGSLQRLDGLLVDLYDQVRRLAQSAGRRDQHPEVAARIATIVESAHFMLETFVSVGGSDDPIDRAYLAELTGDRTATMEKIRVSLMSELGADAASERDLFDASLSFERLVWLMRRYTLVAEEPDSPYRDRANAA
ncbi:MAG: Na/Pi cotransporter family protein [Alphaproteobacteria bacterium]|nr:Na/Pi cotransporter family protein [Alphaproteobacteria bacterium]